MFVIFSKAKKELELEFLGGLVGKLALNGPIEVGLIDFNSTYSRVVTSWSYAIR